MALCLKYTLNPCLMCVHKCQAIKKTPLKRTYIILQTIMKMKGADFLYCKLISEKLKIGIACQVYYKPSTVNTEHMPIL